MFGKTGAPVPGMLSMLAGMLGVSPDELAKSITDIQAILSDTASAMHRIEVGNKALLANQLVIMTSLNCQGKYDDGSSDRGSAPSLAGPGTGT
jgi:hypothetical protein